MFNIYKKLKKDRKQLEEISLVFFYLFDDEFCDINNSGVFIKSRRKSLFRFIKKSQDVKVDEFRFFILGICVGFLQVVIDIKKFKIGVSYIVDEELEKVCDYKLIFEIGQSKLECIEVDLLEEVVDY